MSARRRIEIASVGIDDSLQLIGSDPFGGSAFVGLRVPFLPTSAVRAANGGSFASNRYLFLAAVYSVAEGSCGRVIGYRELVTIGTRINVGAGDEDTTFRVVEQEVTSPVFHFSDASAPSFHLFRLGPNPTRGMPHRSPVPGPNLESTAFRFSDVPALLFDKIAVPAGDPYYVDLTGYTPPNGGRPWETPLADGHQKTMHGLRTSWRTPDAWWALQPGEEFEGPDTFGLFISVAQTDPGAQLALPVPNPFFPGGLSPEEQFLLNFPKTGQSTGVQYWRVGGSLIVEIDGGRGSKGGLCPADTVTPELRVKG